MKHISSRQNPLVARVRAVARGEDRTAILLDGVHLVGEALAAGIAISDAALTPEALETPALEPLIAALTVSGAALYSVSAPVMDALSPVHSASPVIALARRPTAALDDLLIRGDAPIVAACGIQDPGNLGAIVRVAEAGGTAGVLVLGASADPFGWKALRGSMGSALRVPLATAPSPSAALAEARRQRWRMAATVPRDGAAPEDVSLDGRVVLLIGGEGQGLSSDIVDAADLRVTIPMTAPVESLNAAVSAALLVYEARRQRLARLTPHGLSLPGHA